MITFSPAIIGARWIVVQLRRFPKVEIGTLQREEPPPSGLKLSFRTKFSLFEAVGRPRPSARPPSGRFLLKDDCRPPIRRPSGPKEDIVLRRFPFSIFKSTTAEKGTMRYNATQCLEPRKNYTRGTLNRSIWCSGPADDLGEKFWRQIRAFRKIVPTENLLRFCSFLKPNDDNGRRFKTRKKLECATTQ